MVRRLYVLCYLCACFFEGGALVSGGGNTVVLSGEVGRPLFPPPVASGLNRKQSNLEFSPSYSLYS